MLSSARGQQKIKLQEIRTDTTEVNKKIAELDNS